MPVTEDTLIAICTRAVDDDEAEQLLRHCLDELGAIPSLVRVSLLPEAFAATITFTLHSGGVHAHNLSLPRR